jgi:hypothetical protein
MPENALTLAPEAREEMVKTKVTCPFLGSLVHQELLGVRGASGNPLAGIEDIRQLGNEGGGDLGDLLVFFATGNHAFMRGSSGLALDAPVPAGLFSLELPGSQGSHPGHSGILQGDPTQLASGRLSRDDFARLAAFAIDGILKRSDVGRFIARNLRKDQNSKVALSKVAALLGLDLAGIVEAISTNVVSRVFTSEADPNNRQLEQRLTKLWATTILSALAESLVCSSRFCPMTPRQRNAMVNLRCRSVMFKACSSRKSFRLDGRHGKNLASIGSFTRPRCCSAPPRNTTGLRRNDCEVACK